MKTITVNVYSFNELSQKAKERAKYDYMSVFGYSRADEAIESLSALAKHFDGRLKDYEIDFFKTSHSYARFDMPDYMSKQEFETRLRKLGSYNKRTGRGNGDCVLTGVSTDEDAIDGLRLAYRNGEARSLERLMQAAFKSWLKACQDDCEDQYSDETFSEHCEANEYLFLEDGEIAPK